MIDIKFFILESKCTRDGLDCFLRLLSVIPYYSRLQASDHYRLFLWRDDQAVLGCGADFDEENRQLNL